MQSSKSYTSSGKSEEELTKRPWTSCLNDEKRNGIFYCACCNNPLFKSSTKFESGSGWPSFWEPIKSEEDDYESVYYEKDGKFGMVRVEVLCSKCDAR